MLNRSVLIIAALVAATCFAPAVMADDDVTTGHLEGVVQRDCGTSILSGCMGQGIPQTTVIVRLASEPDPAQGTKLDTADDGSFAIDLPPGAYVVEHVDTGAWLQVDVELDQTVDVTLPVKFSTQPGAG